MAPGLRAARPRAASGAAGGASRVCARAGARHDGQAGAVHGRARGARGGRPVAAGAGGHAAHAARGRGRHAGAPPGLPTPGLHACAHAGEHTRAARNNCGRASHAWEDGRAPCPDPVVQRVPWGTELCLAAGALPARAPLPGSAAPARAPPLPSPAPQEHVARSASCARQARARCVRRK